MAIQLLQFIFGLAVLILLHEFGHFIAARMFNIEVEEFGIGFPPRIVKLFEHKGTEYSLNWIPLGGFVRPKGENDPEVKGGLAAANPWVRLAVYIAGPATNLLVGVILGIILFYSVGDPIEEKVLVRYVELGSPAAEAGLQEGDLFVAVNGELVDGVEKLQILIFENLDIPIELTMDRDGQIYTAALIPRANPPEGQGAMGVGLDHPSQPVSLGIAASRGVNEAFNHMRGITMLPLRLIQGQATPDEGRLVGYRGMFDIYRWIEDPLWFFMAISISLGIVNLFPIPALDGGRILLTLPEIIIRRRIPSQYETMIHMVGFTVLLLLLIYINLQDFINPLQLPNP